MLVMMKREEDKLRSFIEQNKQAFDGHRAPAGIWDQIDLEVNGPKSMPWKWYILLGLLVISGALGIGYYFGQHNGSMSEEVNSQQKILEYAGLPDFEETRQYYITQVNETWKELRELHYDATLEQDLNLIDKTDDELKNELLQAEGIYKEHVLQAMIQNQQIKLNLLINVLEDIKSQTTLRKSKKYESI